ncbi:MAG: hypothetical protein E7630_03445 [Ruminococcaceae bacterium]|nr:hypothetical protein [Oscillospiraceae bacterium]
MECLKNKLARLCEVLGGLKNLQITLKGNAEVALHTKNAPDTPKAKAEIVEDGATVDLTDLLLVGVALTAVGSVVSLICDLFD